MNLIHIAGHLGADAEERFTPSGKKVVNLRVATRTRRSKQGADDTIWWRVTLWGDQYDKMLPYLKKGSAVVVVGEVHKPEIFTPEGKPPQVSLEITAFYLQFSPFGKPGGNQQQGTQQTAPAAPFGVIQDGMAPNPYMGGMPTGTKVPEGATFDDEVPF